MAHLLHKYHSSALFLGIGMLMLFSFCAPAFASDAPATPTFRSTSPFGINQTIQGATVNINGIHQGTIYKPFSSDHPYADLNPGSGSGGSSDPNDDVGIPGWADTPSEPLPIGDGMGILLLMATMMVGAIFLKQRKQLSESISKSTTSTTNINNLRGNQLPTALKKENNTTQHMTTRKQTYQSFFQKLFLLLAFVCFVGQVSADKTIYFRPGTRNFSIGYQTKAQAVAGTESKSGSIYSSNKQTWNEIYWIKNGRVSYKVVGNGKSDILATEAQTVSETELKNGASRFIPINIPTGYTGVYIFRLNAVTDADYAKWNGTNNNNNVLINNTIPVWTNSTTKYPSSPEPVNRDDEKNLIFNREGWWDVYDWGYYIPKNSNIEIYFADINGWNNKVQMLTGKDIYSYPTPAFTKIDNTKLHYLQLTKEYGYEQYGFIGNSSAWSESGLISAVAGTSSVNFTATANTIVGFVDDANIATTAWNNGTASNSNLNTNNNRVANRIKKATKYTGLYADLLKGKNLYIPGASNGASLTKQTLTSYTKLNHKQYVTTYGGGSVTIASHKLNGATSTTPTNSTVSTGTTNIDAAYTATVTLTATAGANCKFLGWYDENWVEKSTELTYTYTASNSEKTHYAIFSAPKQVRTQFFADDKENPKYNNDDWTNSSEGGKLTIEYTKTNSQSYIEDFDQAENKTYNDIQPGKTLKITATPKDGYVFVGFWNNLGYPVTTNPWEITNPENYKIPVTARFAKTFPQTVNVYTYNSGTGTFDMQGTHGGSVTIEYPKVTNTNAGCEQATATTTTTWTDNVVAGTMTLTATAEEGYTFMGWYDGATCVGTNASLEYAVESSRTINAYFAIGQTNRNFSVRTMIYNGSLIESLDGGTFTMTHSGGITYTHAKVGSQNILVSNAPVTFEATPESGYEFIGWFNVEDEKRYPDNPWIIDHPMDTEKYLETITAIFASSKTYAKKQNINIEGPGTVEASYIFYKDGTSKTTTFEQSSSFVAWTGTKVTLTANPLAGYKFDGWYEGGSKQSENSTYSYDATSARTITAKFVSEVNKLTVSVLNYDTKYNEFREYEYEYNTITLKDQNGTQLATSYSSFSHKFDDATTVTLTATPEDGEDGYDFIGWYQNGEQISTDAEISVNVIGIQAISAHFAPTKCFNVRLLPPKGGTYSVKYARESLFNQEGMCYVVHTPYDKEINIYVPYDAKIAVVNPKPINGYEYLGFKVFHGNDNNDGTFSIIPPSGKDKYEEVDLPAVIPNFVRTEEQVVYLDISNKDKDSDWADVTTFQCNKRNPANNSVNLEVSFTEKVDEFANIYKITIEAKKFDNIDIIGDHNTREHTTGRLAIPSTRYNCFKLNAYQSSTGEWVDAWTTLPTQTGDYRLIYREQTVVSKNEIRIDYEFNEGDRIKNINFDNQTATTKTDTVSLHIYNKVSDGINGVNNPEVILQQWNGIEWADVECYMVFGPLRSNNTGVIKMPNRKNTTGEKISVDQGIGNIIAEADGDDQACGVWNFVIQQTKDNADNVTAKLLVNETHRYTGNYYIRTTNADGQYNNYIHPSNVMKFSEYAAANSDYSHYFIRNVDINEDGTPTAQAGKHNQVKFTVATAYTEFLCKELMINNNRFSEDEYENDIFVINDNNNPKLPADATVRFGWDSVTNRLTRAYIANTTIKNNEYLVVEGTNIGSTAGDAAYFTDNSNWLYSIDLPDAKASAKAKVKAKMNGQYQYFMGSGSQDGYETLISGNGANTYPIRLLYDFKDDRFTTIYRPKSGTINNDVELSTPLMIEREHNEPATQIQLETNKKITTVQAGEDQYTQPAYAVMTFLESVLADASKTHHEKMFYWISFPFDVCIRDVFGLGDYGKYWIMEEYDGAQRAASGLAQNNWKYITKKSAVLSKNVGYVLCLNYSQILQDQLFKSYGSSDQELNSGKLSLYFPSNGIVDPKSIVGGQNATIDLAEYYNANTAWNHHNWHIIGVPSFANPGTIDEQQDAPFVYQYWHPGDAYAAVSINDVKFQSMHAYMVQYAGEITWTNKIVNTGGNVSGGKSLAAKTDEDADKNIMLRLELQQAGSTLDKTYVQLRNDKGTKGFDMSLDLTKIINAGANIYSIVDNHEMAGNAIPKDETVLPLGVVITAAGEYTFAMPNGTEGMIVELIDYEQGTSTNLLMSDYTITLDKGTFNQRFALRLKPDKVATSVDNIGNGADGDKVRKLLIDGVLYLVKDGAVYDAQGHCVR